MASAMDTQPAAARLSAVAAVGCLPQLPAEARTPTPRPGTRPILRGQTPTTDNDPDASRRCDGGKRFGAVLDRTTDGRGYPDATVRNHLLRIGQRQHRDQTLYRHRVRRQRVSRAAPRGAGRFRRFSSSARQRDL